MSQDDFDDGLVHGHDWAAEPVAKRVSGHPHVADAASIVTPSCVVHDDVIEVGHA